MAAEIVTIILGFLDAPAKIKQYVVDPIKDQFRYVHRYGDIMEDLRIKNELLTSTIDHLRKQIQAAKDNLHNIVPNVEDWCRRVDQRTEEIDSLLAVEPRVQNDTCLQGTCSSLKLRYSRSRKATKLIAEIDELLKEYNEFRSHISDPAPVETILETSGTLEFDSRKQKEEEIMSYLRDHSIYMIGVWGMGGVGKTTMANKIRERASKEKLFDRTAMAVVSRQVDQLEIQRQLAEDLGLDLTNEAKVDNRAKKLSTRLMKEKVLIILDDVWERLNIKELGIPAETKILLTTRDRRGCPSMSRERPTKILTLGLLNEVEAFSLFRDKAGSVVDQPNLRPIAMNVARECKGLPLALAIFGGALEGENNESSWKAFLRQLQKSAPTNIDEDLEDLYPRLELSYHELKSEEDKYLFLLCCLFPEDSDIEIEDLVRYVVGLPNFSATVSIIDARDKVNLIVRRLVARCLLMDAGDESWPTYVKLKMHDVIRDMALSIASRDEHKFKVSHDKGLREWPHGSYACISLTLGEAMPFQEGMPCPGLKALLLTFDLSSTTPILPGNFLNGMADLTLLEIRGSYRSVRLPLLFLSSLAKLRVLLLHECSFEDTDTSFLGQVKNLEILSCRRSDIKELPNEIIALSKLKLLDMTGCWKLKNIAPGVIPALVNLEELRLMGCPIEWDCQETGDERRNASLAEVFSLKNLSILEVWIKDLEVISQKMDYSPELTSYSISIGREGGELFWRRPYNNPKHMSVFVDERMVFPDAISKLIEDVKELKLKGNGCKGIIELLGREGFVNITSLEIHGLGDVKILVEPMDRVIFPNLRHLKLSSMNELEGICNGHPQVGSFAEVKKITIANCAKLKWVFPLSIAESLCKLESIDVRDCPVVEEVFEESESGTTTVKFPSAKNMKLRGLPGLGAWCKAVDATIEFPSIESLDISASSNFKIFGNLQLADKVTCTKLKNSCMRNLGMEIFYREVPIGFFSGVEVLVIKSFHRLRVLFSLIVFKDLLNLKNLIVEDCVMLENIVEMENEDEEHTNVTIQKLEELQLSKLPKICYFWPFTCALEFPSLERVRITDCPKMETFAVIHSGCSSSIPKFFGQQVTFTKLKGFFMSTHSGSRISLPLFSSAWIGVFHIGSSHNLKTLFSPAIFRALVYLWKLTVKGCMMLEDIVEMEKDEDEGHRNNISKISPLKELELSKLPKIRYFGHFSDAIEFPSLEKVNVEDCAIMETFVVVSNALEFPSLEVVTIEDCPKMETFVVAELGSSSSMSGGSMPERNFFTKQVTFTKLKELTMSHFSMEISPIGFFSALETLHIESFHSLRILFSPAILKALGNLQKLTVEDCMMLEDIVEMDEAHRNNISKISPLKELELSKLPRIRYFGHFSDALEFPSLEKVIVEDCAIMETFVVVSNALEFPSLQEVTIEDCPRMETFVVVSNALEFPSLEEVTIEDCPRMETFIVVSDALEFPSLQEVTIEDCPKMEAFVVVSNALEFPSLEVVTIEDCPKMETFVVGELGSSSSMFSGSMPVRNFFTEQVTCPKLQTLLLEGLKISGLLFSPETPIASLGALYWLEIKSCHNLKSLFTSRMFEGLTSLCWVTVTDCSLFEEVIAKDEDENENVDEMVVNIPKVESLQLRELPKLCWFSHIRRDLEFSSVQFIDLSGCTEIMKSSFCLGGGSVRICTGVRVEGISNPEFASQFFFPTQSLDFIQHLQEEDTLDDGCFMLLSSDLSFTWDSDEDLLVVKGSSNAFFFDGWKKACGKFNMEKLSPGITYEIVFAIMLFKLSFWREDDQLETMMGDDKREHEVKNVPRQEWIEILVGELMSSSGQCGDITFSLQKNNKNRCVALKCVSIRPKRISSDVR